MKKMLYFSLLGVILSFSFVNFVFAEEDNMEVLITAGVENTTVLSGSDVEIIINIKSDKPVQKCIIKVDTDDTLQYVNMNYMGEVGVWQGSGDVSTEISLTKDNNNIPLTDGEDALKLTYKVNGEGSFRLTPVECTYGDSTTNESYQDTSIESQTVNFKIQAFEEDYTLSKLEVANGEVITSVGPNVENYMIKLNSVNFGLDIETNNPDYNDDIVVKYKNDTIVNDLKNITFVSDADQEVMILEIVVNNVKKYTLMIEYIALELDSSIKSIILNGEELIFETGKYEYEYTVQSDVTSIVVTTITLNDSTNFKISDNSNVPGTINIDKENAYLHIVVEPVSDTLGATEAYYYVTIKKEAAVDEPTEDPEDESREEDKTDDGQINNNDNVGNSDLDGNTTVNPGTGGVSMYIMGFILILSLVGSVVLYNKNLKKYE